MKKVALINAPLPRVVAGMGHADGFCVSDAGSPVPAENLRVDVPRVIPAFPDIIRIIPGYCKFQSVILCQSLEMAGPGSPGYCNFPSVLL